MSSTVIRSGDGNRYPALVTSEGKLMVDTELTVSGITIENVTTFKDRVGALRFGLVDTDSRRVQVDIATPSGTIDVDVPGGVGVHYIPPIAISGIDTSSGRIPVDTELTIAGDVIIENVKVQSAPLTEVYASGTFPVTDNSGSLTVDGTVSVGHPIVISGTQNALPVTDNNGSLTVDGGVFTTTPVVVSGIQNTVTVTGDDSGSLTVDGGVKLTEAVVVSGIQDTVTVDGIVDLAEAVNISGIATNDAAASSVGPQIMSAYDSTKPAAVADGDAVRVLSDQYGRLLQGIEPEHFQATIQSFDATSATQIKAKTADKKMYLTTIMVAASGAMSVKLQDDAGTPNIIVDETYLTTTDRFILSLADSSPLVVTTNQDLDVITSAAGGVTVTVAGYLAT